MFRMKNPHVGKQMMMTVRRVFVLAVKCQQIILCTHFPDHVADYRFHVDFEMNI